MPEIRDYDILDLSGGVVRNKSDFQMDKNEVKLIRNFDNDESGRLKRRPGYFQFGATISGKSLDNSVLFNRVTLGTGIISYHLVVDRAANATLYRIFDAYTTAAITTASTSIAVSANNLSASGSITIDGDTIAYTGGGGSNTLTGVTGIYKSHPALSYVAQIQTIGATGIDGRTGIYFSILNNLLVINGKGGSATFDGTTISAIADANEAAGLFACNYRDRLYAAGDGSSDGSGTRNGDPRRVSYTDPGDATDWGDYTVNFFDVEDDRGEPVMGLTEGSDHLVIWKPNSIFSYDEVQLQQQLYNVGAYCQRVIQRIGNLFYTFCPSGIYVTNGFSAERISDPVAQYLKSFRPQYAYNPPRFVSNCFSGQFKGKYLLYIGNITEPEVLSDVVLVYDTVRKKWTIYSGFANFQFFATLSGFGNGAWVVDATQGNQGDYAQVGEALFAGDSAGKYWRMFDSRFEDQEATRGVQGGEVLADAISNNAGTAVSYMVETKFYEVGNPSTWKEIEAFVAYAEQGDFKVSYRWDKGNGEVTEWQQDLGEIRGPQTMKRLKDNAGLRIAFRVTGVSADTISVFNGIVLKNPQLKEKLNYAA